MAVLPLAALVAVLSAWGASAQSCSTAEPWLCSCSNARRSTYALTVPVTSSVYPPFQTFGTGPRNKPYFFATNTAQRCCEACFNLNVGSNSTGTKACEFWAHHVTGTINSCTGGGNSQSCGRCVIFPAGFKLPCGSGPDLVTVGKGCIEGKNDPHFVGAHGTGFEFNGMPDQSFCLITDPSFQINMKMVGYLDERTYGASILQDGKAVRTWIKELGILWVDQASGKQHGLKLRARDGKSAERGDGLMGSMELDGKVIPRMHSGDTLSGEGGLTLTFVGEEVLGNNFYYLDVYRVTIDGLLDLLLKIRVAHPLLQLPNDAFAHFNIEFERVAHSPRTHGVLGQTYGSDRAERGLKFSTLAKIAGHNLAADSKEFEGFLDGTPKDYQTPDVLSPNCKYTAFNGRLLPGEKAAAQ